jgi:hypothetical protein
MPRIACNLPPAAADRPHQIARRTVLLCAASTLFMVRLAYAGKKDPATTAAEIVALITDPDIIKLDPESALRRLSFRGGTPVRSEKPNGVIYELTEDHLTYAHVELSKIANGWQLDTLSLLFGLDSAPSLKALEGPLTAKFGKPRDATTGNAVWIWQAPDRVIRITADVPGAEDPKVYVATVMRMR